MSILYNGLDLASGPYIATNVVRQAGVRGVELVNVPGRDGSFLGLTDLQPITVTMDVVIQGSTPSDRAASLHDLLGALDGSMHALSFDDEDGYWLAVASGGEVARYADALVLQGLVFTCPDPVMHGEHRSSSNGSITVGGNHPTSPVVTIEAGPGQTGAGRYLIGAILDESSYVHVETDITSTVVIDCASRTVTLNGVTAIPTRDSDWLELDPGEHTVRVDYGTPTSFSIEWDERWI